MELTYTKIGDYYYPDLCLPQTDDDRPLGKYGMLRKNLSEAAPTHDVRPAAAGWGTRHSSAGYQ